MMINRIGLRGLKAANHKVLRDTNEIIVLNLIRERQPISRIAIAELSGLEPGTVTRILQRFLRNNLISETGSGPSSPMGGRKPRYVTLNPLRHCAIGVDLGARETVLALCDFTGQIQDFRRITNTTDPETTLQEVANEILSLKRRANAYEEFGGVGVALIGLIDCEKGIILEGENLGWPEPVEVGRILRSKIKGVPLYFENNARLSAMGEMWFGSARHSGIRDLVFLDINEGVGTGIVIDGQLYRGYRNGAGEFGHVCIDPQGPRCSCGSYGCLEVLASDTATIKRYLQRCGTSDASRIDMKFIVELASKGDAYAVATIKETAHYLGLGLAPIIYGLSPEKIILGGTIAEAWTLVEAEIWKACAERVSEPFLKNTTLVAAATEHKASLMGAISLVLARSFALPTSSPRPGRGTAVLESK
jgi:predicted NBD/HSP70 family sugar kinase